MSFVDKMLTWVIFAHVARLSNHVHFYFQHKTFVNGFMFFETMKLVCLKILSVYNFNLNIQKWMMVSSVIKECDEGIGLQRSFCYLSDIKLAVYPLSYISKNVELTAAVYNFPLPINTLMY